MAARPDLYVLARLLQRLARGDACGRGELQTAARLNYDLLRKYLDYLVERKMVARAGQQGRKELFQITSAGSQAYRDLPAWLDAWVGQLP